jgi:hypothetical protein
VGNREEIIEEPMGDLEIKAEGVGFVFVDHFTSSLQPQKYK